MTFTDLAKKLEKEFSVGVGGLRLWGTCLRFRNVFNIELAIIAQFPQIPHRDTGKPGGLEHWAHVRRTELVGKTDDEQLEYCVQATRESLRRFMLHELDECLLWGGERKWDPHVRELLGMRAVAIVLDEVGEITEGVVR